MTIQVCQIQIRQGTAAQWIFANPTLLVGELGLETDTGRMKIGDGLTQWTDLRTTPIVLGPNSPGNLATSIFPTTLTGLNFCSADPLAGSSLVWWIGSNGAAPQAGAVIQVLKSGNNIIAPADPTPPFLLMQLAFAAWDSGAGAYNFGAQLSVGVNGIKTPFDDWPSYFQFQFTSDTGSALDCYAQFYGQSGVPILFLSGPTDAIALTIDSTGRALIGNNTVFTPVGVLADDLGMPNVPDPSAQLDLQDDDRGMLFNRMTTLQRLAIVAPAESLVVYDTDRLAFRRIKSGVWRDIQGYPIFSGAKISHTGPYLIPSSTLATTLVWNTVLFDTDAYFQPIIANDRFIIPFDGWFRVGFALAFTPGFANVIIQAQLVSSGLDMDVIETRHSATNTERITPRGEAIAFLLSGTSVQLKVTQQSGVALDCAVGGPGVFISPLMWIEQLGVNP